MNSRANRQVISLAIVACIAVVMFYGSYLPLRKSQLFISAMSKTSSIRSLNDFRDVFSVPLTASSPIGQEELVRNIANTSVGYVDQARDGRVAQEIVSFIEKYYAPIIDDGKGMSFTQNLYVLGVLNTLTFAKTHDVRYFVAAKRYAERGLELSPTRPQFLYALFDIYRVENNPAKVKEISDKVLSQWPNDQKFRQLSDAYFAKAAPTK